MSTQNEEENTKGEQIHPDIDSIDTNAGKGIRSRVSW